MSTTVLTSGAVESEALSVELILPRSGPWIAACELPGDLEFSAGDAATLTIAPESPGDGDPQVFAGTLRRVGPWQGRTRAVLIAGAGGLRAPLAPQDLVGKASTVSSALIAASLATATGETLAASVAAVLASYGVPRWMRVGTDLLGQGGTGAEALDVLVSALRRLSGSSAWAWRFDADGALRIGADTWPESSADLGNVWIDDDADGRIDCAPPVASLRPGTTLLGRRIERVTYRITESTSRAELLYSVAGDVTGSTYPSAYAEQHGAEVIRQNADGTIDVQCDDARLGGVRMLVFRHGAPGLKVEIPAGFRVSVVFDDADPSRPFAHSIEPDPAATKYLALKDDIVDGGTITALGVAPGAPIIFLTTPGGGGVPVSSTTATVIGKISGPCHKYVKGVPA